MATRTVANGGGNWNSTGTWVEGAVPTSADDVVFTVTSGALTLNTTGNCKTFDTTNNASTITWNASLNVSGNLTLTGGFTITTTSGSPQLIPTATGTITTNGVTFPYIFAFAGTSQSFTLADTLTVANLVFQHTSAVTILGNQTINTNGNLTFNSSGSCNFSGSTINILGTGTWTHASVGFLENGTLNINSSGTVTLGTNRFRGGVLNYVAGSLITTSNTLFLTAAASGTTTLNTSGMTWNNINIGGNTSHTYNANTTVYCSGILGFGGGGGILQGMWETSGSLTHTGGTTYTNVAGATVTMTGTGNLSTTSGGSISCNLVINTSGTITISSATFRYNTGTFTYTAGTVITTGSTLTISLNCTLATNGIIWNNITTTTGLTIFTLSNKLMVSGELWLQGDTTISGDVFEVYGLMIGLITTSNSVDLILVSTKEYIISGYIHHYGARSLAVGTISASTPTSKALLTLQQGATQIIGYVNVTDIDSRNGLTLRSYDGIFSNTDNWLKLNIEYSIGGEF